MRGAVRHQHGGVKGVNHHLQWCTRSNRQQQSKLSCLLVLMAQTRISELHMMPQQAYDGSCSLRTVCMCCACVDEAPLFNARWCSYAMCDPHSE
jgi:hypothetical protein